MKLRAAVLSAMLIVNACGGGGNGPSGPPTGSTTGSLRGNVNDQTGAPVPSATVTLTATGQTPRTSVTAANGSYTFSSLPVGTYTVTVTPPNGYQLGGGTGTTKRSADGVSGTGCTCAKASSAGSRTRNMCINLPWSGINAL